MSDLFIDVNDGGLLTTLQDKGRIGYQKYGILVNGAMDTWSLAMANLVCGNEPYEAALELTLRGPEMMLPAGLVFALAGADMGATLDGAAVPLGRPVLVTRDAVLAFHGCRQGCRAYLAVAGGYDVPLVMGSRSTYLRAGLGGFKGRSLAAGDRIPVREAQAIRDAVFRTGHAVSSAMATVDWFAPRLPKGTAAPVRATAGLQIYWFTEASRRDFVRLGYRITMQADRMGYRLSGEKPLELEEPRELISEPVAFGTVQVADGKPIILMADRQTTGGYPKIAQIASCDLPRLGQCKGGDVIHFAFISPLEAERLYMKQVAAKEQIALSVKLALGLAAGNDE